MQRSGSRAAPLRGGDAAAPWGTGPPYTQSSTGSWCPQLWEAAPNQPLAGEGLRLARVSARRDGQPCEDVLCKEASPGLLLVFAPGTNKFQLKSLQSCICIRINNCLLLNCHEFTPFLYSAYRSLIYGLLDCRSDLCAPGGAGEQTKTKLGITAKLQPRLSAPSEAVPGAAASPRPAGTRAPRPLPKPSRGSGYRCAAGCYSG